MFDDDRVKDQYNHLLNRMGDLHRRLHDKARERGSNDGGRLLLTVEGTGEQTMHALRAIHEAGIPVDFSKISNCPDLKKEWLQQRTGARPGDIAPLHTAVDELQRGFEDVHRAFEQRYGLPALVALKAGKGDNRVISMVNQLKQRRAECAQLWANEMSR